MGLLWRRNDAVKKWRVKAMLVDPHKTRITLCVATRPRRIPPWMYRNLQEVPSDTT